MKNQIRIAIAEPKSLSFETLSNMLSSHKPLTVIQSFRNGRQVLQHLNEEITDILLLSYELLKIVNAD